MAEKEGRKAPPPKLVAPSPSTLLPTPQDFPTASIVRTPATAPAGASAVGGTGAITTAALVLAPLDSRNPPPVRRKNRSGPKGKGPANAAGPSVAEAAPTTVASSSIAAPLPAVPSTSFAIIPPPAPRTYARVATGPPSPAASSSRPPTASAAITSSRGPLPALTRKHGVRCLLVPASPHVEAYVQALAKVVGPMAIVAASKMYGKVVFFLASETAAQEAVEKGLVVGGVFLPLEPLEDLGVRFVLTSVPPFLPNVALLPALSALGKLVSVISPLPLGCKDPALRHVLSFRRQVQILLPAGVRDGEALEGSFLVPYQGARYRVFYSTGEARCYLCRSAGHVRRDCPLARGRGAPETPETRRDIGPVVADTPGHPAPDTTPPPTRSTAAPVRAQEAPLQQRPGDHRSPTLAVTTSAEPMEGGVAKLLPGAGEGSPQGEPPAPTAALPLPPQTPEPLPPCPAPSPATQPPDDAMEGWTVVQGKRGKRRARAPLHSSDAEAPRKTRKGGTDLEPPASATSEIHSLVSGGEDRPALEGGIPPPRGTLPSEAPGEAPSNQIPPELPTNPDVTAEAGPSGEAPGVVGVGLSSVYAEIEALDLTPVTQGGDDLLPAGLDLGNLTPGPLSPCPFPLTAFPGEHPTESGLPPGAMAATTTPEPVPSIPRSPLPCPLTPDPAREAPSFCCSPPEAQGLTSAPAPTPIPVQFPSSCKATAAPGVISFPPFADSPQGAVFTFSSCDSPGVAPFPLPSPSAPRHEMELITPACQTPRRRSAPCLPALADHEAVSKAPPGTALGIVTLPPHELQHALREFLKQCRGARDRAQLALQQWGDFDRLLRAARALMREGRGQGKGGAAAYERARSFRKDLLTHGMGHGLLCDPPGAMSTPTTENSPPPQPSA
ncbi:unnamed protein product [Lepidochelys olivacea]